jgi:hypothetical protein
VEKRGANIVISQWKNRIEKRPIDNDIYKWRHLVVISSEIREFKRVAMRSDKTCQSFKAMVYFTAAVINSRWLSTGYCTYVQTTLLDGDSPSAVNFDKLAAGSALPKRRKKWTTGSILPGRLRLSPERGRGWGDAMRCGTGREASDQ